MGQCLYVVLWLRMHICYCISLFIIYAVLMNVTGEMLSNVGLELDIFP